MGCWDNKTLQCNGDALLQINGMRMCCNSSFLNVNFSYDVCNENLKSAFLVEASHACSGFISLKQKRWMCVEPKI